MKKTRKFAIVCLTLYATFVGAIALADNKTQLTAIATTFLIVLVGAFIHTGRS